MNHVAQSLEYFPNVHCAGVTSLPNMLTSNVSLVGGVTAVVIEVREPQ